MDEVGGGGRSAGPAGDEAMHRAAVFEEMVAQTHERAADLYESWLDSRTGARVRGLEERVRMHRERAAAARSFGRLTERTMRVFEAGAMAAAPSAGKVRQLVALAALERLRDALDGRIEEVVAAGRHEGASWAEIGTALRVTKQSAHERYRHRALDVVDS